MPGLLSEVLWAGCRVICRQAQKGPRDAQSMSAALQLRSVRPFPVAGGPRGRAQLPRARTKAHGAPGCRSLQPRQQEAPHLAPCSDGPGGLWQMCPPVIGASPRREGHAAWTPHGRNLRAFPKGLRPRPTRARPAHSRLLSPGCRPQEVGWAGTLGRQAGPAELSQRARRAQMIRTFRETDVFPNPGVLARGLGERVTFFPHQQLCLSRPWGLGARRAEGLGTTGPGLSGGHVSTPVGSPGLGVGRSLRTNSRACPMGLPQRLGLWQDNKDTS